ncbi:MAG: hypothetical protein JSS34_02685 [Proteobacteria bacterium]|nr:hypothetical protein [Pseudomonadota bacterium]
MKPHNPIFLLTKKDGNPSSALLHLFQALNLSTVNLKQMTEDLHKYYMRKPGIDRWQMQEVPFQKDKILPFLKKLGFVEEILPSKETSTSPHYIFIHGGHVEKMQSRINFFNTKIWPNLSKETQEKGHIIFLTGDRKLNIETSEKENLLNPNPSQIPIREGWIPPQVPPLNESDAARIIWDQLILNETLRNKILFIDAPCPQDYHRPTTKDTLTAWLTSFQQFQKKPSFLPLSYQTFWKNAPDIKKSSFLVISNNPFILYQDLVFRNFLQEKGLGNVYLETVGSKANDNVLLAVYLDNLARTLLEIQKFLQQKKFFSFLS